MRPKTPEGFVRPLLATGRSEILNFLRERRIPWREDHTNAELVFARNRIRHELLPALEREWNPAVVEALCRTAILAAEDEAFWEAEVARAAPLVLREEPNRLIVDCARLATLPAALGRRILRSAVARIRGGLRGIEFDHIETLLALASGRQGGGRLILPGVDALRSFDFIRLAKPEAARQPRNWSLPVRVPAKIPLDGGKCLLCLEFVPPEGYTGGTGLDGRRVTGMLELRNWRPGDFYQPAGRSRPEKLKTLFQEARIPLWERRNWPILAMEGQILWARRFGPAAEFAASGGSAEILEIREVWSEP
jgi:tRNA(Ile)-lysidine synthase